MTAYAGFKGIADYIETRCREKGLSERALNDALGRGHTYITNLKKGKFVPSKKYVDDIAKYFGDSPRMVRIIAGIEDLPEDGDLTVTAIKEVALSLPKKGKDELLDYAHYLKNKYSNP